MGNVIGVQNKGLHLLRCTKQQLKLWNPQKARLAKPIGLHMTNCGARGRNRTGTPCGGGF